MIQVDFDQVYLIEKYSHCTKGEKYKQYIITVAYDINMTDLTKKSEGKSNFPCG